MSVIKILSIDMDFIMEPCIQLYNDLVHKEPSIAYSWERVMKARDLERHLLFSEDNLNYIKIMLGSTHCPIYVGADHSSIVTMIEDLGIRESVELINVDHHHDYGYSFYGKELVDNYGIATLDNWVYYLAKNSLLKSCLWIKNGNSEDDNYPRGKKEFKSASIRAPIISLDSVDIIFISLSFEWVPPIYQQMVERLVQELSPRIKTTYVDANYESKRRGVLEL